MADGWKQVAKLRTEVADLVEGLSPEQQTTPTLCEGWTPPLVLAHLTSFVEASLPKFFFNIVRHRFDFDKAADASARRLAQRPVGEVAALLRERAAQPAPIKSFPAELTLADVMVHSQDIRRPLGIAHTYTDDELRAVLDFMTSHKQARLFFEIDKIASVTLKATDVDWSAGSGPEVSGAAEALILACCRRPTHDELSGAVDALR